MSPEEEEKQKLGLFLWKSQ